MRKPMILDEPIPSQNEKEGFWVFVLILKNENMMHDEREEIFLCFFFFFYLFFFRIKGWSKKFSPHIFFCRAGLFKAFSGWKHTRCKDLDKEIDMFFPFYESRRIDIDSISELYWTKQVDK